MSYCLAGLHARNVAQLPYILWKAGDLFWCFFWSLTFERRGLFMRYFPILSRILDFFTQIPNMRGLLSRKTRLLSNESMKKRKRVAGIICPRYTKVYKVVRSVLPLKCFSWLAHHTFEGARKDVD
jgi:hypothetical protein